jgi:hypothetical protein
LGRAAPTLSAPPEARKRLFFGVYPGGRILYLQKISWAAIAADIRRFSSGAK